MKSGWKTVALGDVLTFEGVPERVQDPASERRVTVKLYCGGAVPRKANPANPSVPFVGYRVRAGQFIYSRIDARNGAYAIVPEALDGAVVSKDFPVFAIKSDALASGYLMHYLRHGRLQERIGAWSRGATNRQRIKEEQFLGFPLELPPLDEQRRIAVVLDHVDALRTKRRESIAAAALATQSVLKRVSELGTTAVAFGELVDEFRYGTSDKSGPTGLPTLRIPNVLGGRIDLKEVKTVPVDLKNRDRLALQSGDMLFVRTNGNPDNVGRSAVFEPGVMRAGGFEAESTIFASYLIRARLDPEAALPAYIQAFFSSPEGRRRLRSNARTSAGQYNINIEGLRSTVVDLPELGRQKEFAVAADQIDLTRRAAESHLFEIDTLFASLQSRAFAGELDVSKVALPSA